LLRPPVHYDFGITQIHLVYWINDSQERKLWDQYMLAYETMLNKTSTEFAPWYLIPANHNWYRNLVATPAVTIDFGDGPIEARAMPITDPAGVADAVAAARQRAVGFAAVAVVPVPVVALLGAFDPLVAANLDETRAIAAVAVRMVSVVAFLPAADDPIAARRPRSPVGI
jgi:hypothetical protein